MNGHDLDRAHTILTTDAGDEAAADRLYRLWFHRQSGPVQQRPLPPTFHAATLDPDRFERGWTVVETIRSVGRPTVWKVQRQARERFVAHPDLLPARPGEAADLVSFEAGADVVVNPFVSAYSGGFWHLHSPRWQHEGPQNPRQRVYFAVRPGGEIAFVRAFATHGDLKANWAIKLLCGASPTGRRDSAVAYVAQDLPLDRGWLAVVLGAVSDLLDDDASPPGSVPIAPGVAHAPELSDTKSFGQVLCEALVEVSADQRLLLDRERWKTAAGARLASVVSHDPARHGTEASL